MCRVVVVCCYNLLAFLANFGEFPTNGVFTLRPSQIPTRSKWPAQQVCISSRMRTARLLTYPGAGGLPRGCLHPGESAHPPPQVCLKGVCIQGGLPKPPPGLPKGIPPLPPCEQNVHTGVKHYLAPNFVCGRLKCMDVSILRPTDNRISWNRYQSLSEPRPVLMNHSGMAPSHLSRVLLVASL